MLASTPSDASVGVSVLPSSVMSGAFLPLASASFQSVVRTVHGTHTTLTLVLAYCGKSLWNCATTLFIQVTWDGTEPPIRQTVSCAGAAGDVPAPGELLEPELQPAIASAAAAHEATSAAGIFLSPTAGSFRVANSGLRLAPSRSAETNRKVSYKIDPVARSRQRTQTRGPRCSTDSDPDSREGRGPARRACCGS